MKTATKKRELYSIKLDRDYPEFKILAGDTVVFDEQKTDTPFIVAGSIKDGLSIIAREALTDSFFFLGGVISSYRNF